MMQPSQQSTSSSLAPRSPSANSLIGFQHVAAALRGDDFAGHQVFAQVGRLQDAAADGKQAAGARRAADRNRSAARRRDRCRRPSHIRRSSGNVSTASTSPATSGRCGLDLLGDARADEHHLQVVAVQRRSARAVATIGETIGASESTRSG